jgi:hypothetical protein
LARVNRHPDGRAVALQRGSKTASRAASAFSVAKSAGLITLRWVTEKTTSIWFSRDACTGRCTKVTAGQASAIPAIEACRACEEPLPTTQDTCRALAYGSAVIT